MCFQQAILFYFFINMLINSILAIPPKKKAVFFAHLYDDLNLSGLSYISKKKNRKKGRK